MKPRNPIQKTTNARALTILCFLGLALSALMGVAELTRWTESICSGFTQGCREAARFTMLNLPLWIWGILFYSLSVLLVHRATPWLAWLVFAGLGLELGLVWIMLSAHILCPFCVGNFFIITILAFLCFEASRMGQAFASSAVFLMLSFLLIPPFTDPLAAPAENRDRPVAALVAGQSILLEEVDRPLASRLYSLQEEMYRLRKEQLDQIILKIVLQKEADHRGIPLQKLVDEVILGQGVEVSPEELEQYYRDNRERWRDWKGSEEALKQQMTGPLGQQKAYQKIRDYGLALRDRYPVEVYLDPPVLPKATAGITLTGDPTLGPEDAPVTIAEFSDYQCQACRKHHQVVQNIREKYKGKIRWIYKDYPLRGHEWASKAAEAAGCADEQRRFWQYQDKLFSGTEELTVDRLGDYAKALGLDQEAFTRCLDSGRQQAEINKNLEEGRRLGVTMTPTFVINGKLVPGGPPLDQFEKIIEEEILKFQTKS